MKLRNELDETKLNLEKSLKKIMKTPEISNALYDLKEERKEKTQILQKEKRDKLFKESLKKLKNLRNKNINSFRKEDIKETLETICIIGRIEKENIIEEKQKNPEKFIPINEAINYNKPDTSAFCLGLLAKQLEGQGITTVIQKDMGKTEEEKELSIATLDFISNGMINKKKYDLYFDFGEERNEQLLLNEYEQKKFKEKLRKKISKEFGISEDKIILTDPQRGSFQISYF